jgi:hypothetical protein
VVEGFRRSADDLRPGGRLAAPGCAGRLPSADTLRDLWKGPEIRFIPAFKSSNAQKFILF